MISRPVAAAISCRQCQSAIYRAVLSRPTATTSIRSLAQRQPRQLPILSRRLYSQQKSTETEPTTSHDVTPKEELKSDVESSENATITSSESDMPWFLEEEPPRHAPSQHAVDLPKIPEDAPEFLEPMIKYIHEDMGLDDISLLDLRELDPPAALGPNLIMLFGTTRSERHLHVSSGRFVRWLKREHAVSARADGLIGPGELRTKLRRLRKKAKLMGTNTAIIPGGDNGISTGWVCVNFSYQNGQSPEAETFDKSGRFSGFGTSALGTTVVVQCMTEARRAELDLESLWKGVMKKSLREGKTVRGEKTVDSAELDALLASKVQLPTNASALQWQAMERASQQHRHFSTSARRLSHAARTPEQSPILANMNMHRSKKTIKTEIKSHDEPGVILPSFDKVREEAVNVQLLGTPLASELILELIQKIFISTGSIETAADRLSVTDQLLQTTEERGVEIWNNDIFVMLIESIALSPAYGPELQRAQQNFEHLLRSEGVELSNNKVTRLMIVYEKQKNWEKFWDTFRIPPRSKKPRHYRQYEHAFRAMADTRDQKQCIEALRWVYPEMMAENPPIRLIGKLYYSLKNCLAVADPGAWALLHHPPPLDSLDLLKRRRLENREFLRVLREVEQNHAIATQASKSKMGYAAVFTPGAKQESSVEG